MTSPSFSYVTSRPTLERILDIVQHRLPGAYLRFGDGDVNLANNLGELYQDTTPEVAQEMQVAFGHHGPTILKSVPLASPKYHGVEPGMFPGNHAAPDEWCDELLQRLEPWWVGERLAFCPVALHYQATRNPSFVAHFLNDLFSSVDWIIFAANEEVPHQVLSRLIPPGRPWQHIGVPPRQSYSCINTLEQSVLSALQPTYGLIVTAMGCSGRILQSRLLARGLNAFLFDFGSLLDALCGWDTRAWISLSGFKKEAFLDDVSRHHQRQGVNIHGCLELMEPELILDIGASTGDGAARFSKYSKRVVCFEPQPCYARALRERFSMNPRVVVEEIGLAPFAGTLDLSLCSSATSRATFVPQWQTSTPSIQQWDSRLIVSVSRIDEQAKKYGQPDYIKIDVSGFGTEILKGLGEIRPRMISFDFSVPELKNAEACMQLLEELGYGRFNISFGPEGDFCFPEFRGGNTILDEARRGVRGDQGDIYACH